MIEIFEHDFSKTKKKSFPRTAAELSIMKRALSFNKKIKYLTIGVSDKKPDLGGSAWKTTLNANKLKSGVCSNVNTTKI